MQISQDSFTKYLLLLFAEYPTHAESLANCRAPFRCNTCTCRQGQQLNMSRDANAALPPPTAAAAAASAAVDALRAASDPEGKIWRLRDAVEAGPAERDAALAAGALPALMVHATPDAPPMQKSASAWALASCMGGTPAPRAGTVAPALPALAQLLLLPSEVPSVLSPALTALSNFARCGANGGGAGADHSAGVDCARLLLGQPGLPERLCALARHEDPDVAVSAVGVLHAIAERDEAATQAIIEAGALSALRSALAASLPRLQAPACSALITILASSQRHIQAVIDAGIVPLLVAPLRAGRGSALLDHACRAIANVAIGGSLEQQHHLLRAGAVPALCAGACVASSRSCLRALSGLAALISGDGTGDGEAAAGAPAPRGPSCLMEQCTAAGLQGVLELAAFAHGDDDAAQLSDYAAGMLADWFAPSSPAGGSGSLGDDAGSSGAATGTGSSDAQPPPPVADLAAAPAAAPAALTDAAAAPAARDRPLVGLTLAAFRKIIELADGRAALAAKTTAAVKAEFVLPRTRDAGCSVADWLLREAAVDAGAIGRANVFVSHAYDYAFLRVVDALRAWEARQRAAGAPGPFFYYFDLLVVNQHGQGAVVPFEILRDEFGGGVRGVGRTLLFLDWQEPVALQRAWCIFEIFTSLDAGAAFEVVMTPEDETTFEAALRRDFGSLAEKVCAIDAERATAREPADLANIRALVRAHAGGFLGVNRLIISALQDWMAAAGLRALDRLAPHERGTSTLLVALARLLHDQGRLAEAEPLAREAVSCCRERLGEDNPRTLAAMVNLSWLLRDQRKLDEAGLLARDALAGCRVVLGEERPLTLTAMMNMAALLRDRRQMAEAEQLVRELLAVNRRLLGSDHSRTLVSVNSLAKLLQQRRKTLEAEALAREALDGCRRARSGDLLSTLGCAHTLADVLRDLGNAVEAEQLAREALEGRRRVLGNAHMHTLASAATLADVLLLRGESEQAEPLAREALHGYRKHGARAASSLAAALCLVAQSLLLQRKLDDAAPLAREALDDCRRIFGSVHSHTLHAASVLARVLAAQGGRGLDEAEPLAREVLTVRSRMLGGEHADTRESAAQLAALLRARGALDEAGIHARAAAAIQCALGHGSADAAAALALLDALSRDDRDSGAEAPAELKGAAATAVSVAAASPVFVAAACLQRLPSGHWTSFAEPQRLELRDHLLNMLAQARRALAAPAVDALIGLLSRVTTFGWLDEGAGMCGALPKTARLLQASLPRRLIALRVLNGVVAAMSLKAEAAGEPAAAWLQEGALPQVFEAALAVAAQVASRDGPDLSARLAGEVGPLPPEEAALADGEQLEGALALLTGCLSLLRAASGDAATGRRPVRGLSFAAWRSRLASGSAMRVVVDIFNQYAHATKTKGRIASSAPSPVLPQAAYGGSGAGAGGGDFGGSDAPTERPHGRTMHVSTACAEQCEFPECAAVRAAARCCVPLHS